MLMQAAIGRLGVALLPRVLVDDGITAGRLVVPFKDEHRSADAYCLVYRPELRGDPKIQAFRAWLSEDARTCRA